MRFFFRFTGPFSPNFMYVNRENLIFDARSNQIDEYETYQAHTLSIRKALGRRTSHGGAGTCRKVNKTSLELFTTHHIFVAEEIHEVL